MGCATRQPPADRLIEDIFRQQIGKDLSTYLDDLLMYANRHADMLPILARTLGQVIHDGLNWKPHKCQVFPDSIQDLAHIIMDGENRGRSQQIGQHYRISLSKNRP